MKKTFIAIFSILILVLVLGAAVDNTKARELMNQGYEAFQISKNPSKAFLYYKQAIEMASGYIKSSALIHAAYMSHLLGNEVSNYQNFIIEALEIDPELKLNAADYKPSFIEIVNDIRSRGISSVTPTIAKPAPEPVPVKSKPIAADMIPASTPIQKQTEIKSDDEVNPATTKSIPETTPTQSKSVEEKGKVVKQKVGQSVTKTAQKLTKKAKGFGLGVLTGIPLLGFNQEGIILCLRTPSGFELGTNLGFSSSDGAKGVVLLVHGAYLIPVFKGKNENQLLNAMLGANVGFATVSFEGDSESNIAVSLFGGVEVPVKITSNTKAFIRLGLNVDIAKKTINVGLGKSIGFFWFF